MRYKNCITFVAFAAMAALASCTETASEKDGTKARAADSPALAAGCYLGHQSAGGDSVLIQLDTVQGAQLSGHMTISIPEKDRRTGTLSGVAGPDGIVRATYHFMQEGMQDTVQVQLRHDGSNNTLQLRPSAYDPASGREYPDSAKDFSLVLRSVPCK